MANFKWTTTSEKVEELKENKKGQLSSTCQEEIEAGFDYTKDGTDYLISYDREAQGNIQDVLRLFDNNMIDSYILTVSKDGEHTRVEFTKEEFYKLHMESVRHRERNISKLRDVLFPQLESLKTEEEVERFTWDSLSPKEPTEPTIKDPKGLQDQIEGINETFNTLLPEEEDNG